MTEKKYYTKEELDKVMYSYIRDTAEELKINFNKKNKISKNISHV